MKKIISIILGIGLIVGSLVGITALSGCDELPSVEQITLASTSIGYAAGYACELGKINDATRNNILTVLDTIAVIVPTNGQTFTDAWSPVITTTVDKLVKSKKLNKKYVEVVTVAATAAANGVDYIFDVRYPAAKNVKEIVQSVINGFMTGFKSVIKPTDVDTAAKTIKYDVEAYEWFKKNGPKAKSTSKVTIKSVVKSTAKENKKVETTVVSKTTSEKKTINANTKIIVKKSCNKCVKPNTNNTLKTKAPVVTNVTTNKTVKK